MSKKRDERYNRLIREKLAGMSPANKKPAESFVALKTGHRLVPVSIYHYVDWIARVDAHAHGRPLTELEPEDFTDFMGRLRVQKLSASSASQASNCLKIYLRWALDVESLPRRLREALHVRASKIQPNTDIIHYDEIDKLIASCERLRDQALIACHAEAGFRASETVALNVGSCRFGDNAGVWLYLIDHEDADLKSGPRPVYIAKYAELIRAWLQVHPNRTDPDAPLFMSYCGRTKGARLTYTGMKQIIERAYKKAELDYKPPHWFRHSAATRDAESGYSENDLRKKYGWGPTSKMPTWYVHSSIGRQEDIARKSVGLAPDGTPTKNVSEADLNRILRKNLRKLLLEDE